MNPTARQVLVALLTVAHLAPLASADEKVHFNRDVRPILADHCYRCHGPDSASRKAKLRLDDRTIAVQRSAIVPSHAAKSELVSRIFAEDADTVMPPPRVKNPLTKAQKDLLRRWIDEGAEYERHWSFQPIPKTVAVPEIADKWIREPIDAFVLDRLRREKLEPAPEATRETWLRRVSFDLTGLPPTLAEIDAFLADRTPDAYGKVVDRLLASPAYGERMANDWLDVARYADTFGYQADRLMHVWPWRDWVIDAFRKNLPYDQFVLQQTAGDLLPNATRDQKLATAFNRLHRATNEGGSIPEEFRVEYVADRLRTNGMAFLGLTLECARCHDHKFDPISTRDYYRLSAFFDNIDEAGLYSHFTETAPTPALLLYGPGQEAEHRDLLSAIRVKEAEQQAHFIHHRPNVVPEYRDIAAPKPTARFSFDDAKSTGDIRVVPGKFGKALEFGGDDSYSCGSAGQFGRTTPFSMSMWLMPAELSPRMVVLHRSRAAEDSAFRGYSLVLDDGRLVFSLIHFWPGNAIQVRSKQTLPLGVWSHVAFTYDGSSKADGVRLYVDGKAIEVDAVRDRLTRDITHRAEWGDYDTNLSLALGARFRDVGFRKGRIDELQIFDRDLSALEIARVADFPLPHDEASRLDHWRHHDSTAVALSGELRKLRERENDLVSKVPQIMTMQEMPARRTTHVLYRGAYDAPREAVTPGVPDAILPMDPSLPRNRLGFARWLLDDRNPLTARVETNRLWQMLFQRGLVVTAEDFGSQGTPPTHPELLDWLSRRFVDSGWNVQALVKTIVLSATYRQSSRPRDPATLVRDPDNRLLARGARGRLPAEMIRDNALAISGLLVRKIGGPSVFPYQPAGLWEESGTNQSYRQSKGEGLYRRSMYTFWRRTSPPPAMLALDAPSREWCLARRERTSTPAQALVLLNDPQFVEAARVLAEKLMDRKALAERLTTGFRLAASRRPTDGELAILTQMFSEQKARFEQQPKLATDLLGIGESPRNSKLPAAEHAALTVVMQALMNLDDCVSRK